MFDMANPRHTDDHTASLPISQNPRSFRSSNSPINVISEIDLLHSVDHQILLGDPGSGKTTTLKRLARALLHTASVSEHDSFQYPVVLRLRDLRNSSGDLTVEIAQLLGLPIDSKVNSTSDFSSANTASMTVRGKALDRTLYTFLNATQALLLLDGIDEIPNHLRNKIEGQLENLAFNAYTYKVICTCRSGAYARGIRGYSLAEILPLNINQRDEIIEAWSEDPVAFKARVEGKSYVELLNRPLFLVQVLTLYENTGRLPERSSDICKRLVEFSLDKWDSERGFLRESIYSKFSSEEKLEFLCRLAFELHYNIQASVFETRDLEKIYLDIHSEFELPKGQAEKVAREIESHTGLFVKSSFDEFEFSHLSIQEYLAASYIARGPAMLDIRDYMQIDTAPVAVAASLSSNASGWISTLVMKSYGYEGLPIGYDLKPQYLLRRLIIERPRFKQDAFFGFATIILLEQEEVNSELQEAFLNLPNVLISVRMFLEQSAYVFVSDGIPELRKDEITFEWLGGAPKNTPLIPKKSVNISRSILLYILENADFKIRLIDRDEIETWISGKDIQYILRYTSVEIPFTLWSGRSN